MAGLVIRRKANESFWIGDTKVTIQNVNEKRVKLQIEGPRDVLVLRDEIACFDKHGGIQKKPGQQDKE